ncbi:MAG: sugar nucleotide-binding protein [Longicatena sp.]
MKIAITGANGYIASLIQLMNEEEFEFIRITRKEVELNNIEDVQAYFEHLDFDVLVHTAANATTADCENNPVGTHCMNTEASIVLANICKQRKKRMIFFGTEQSFNGYVKKGPFKEEDELIAVTNYGKQKAEADEYIRENLNDYIILRLSWMMGLSQPGIKASPNIIINVMNAIYHQKATQFTLHEIRGMTYAKHLAQNFSNIMKLPSGVYHFSNVNNLNTYESAKLVARKLGVSEEAIERYIVPNEERYADRFRDYRLDNTKIQSHGIILGTFEADVEECLKDYGWM